MKIFYYCNNLIKILQLRTISKALKILIIKIKIIIFKIRIIIFQIRIIIFKVITIIIKIKIIISSKIQIIIFNKISIHLKACFLLIPIKLQIKINNDMKMKVLFLLNILDKFKLIKILLKKKRGKMKWRVINVLKSNINRESYLFQMPLDFTS